MTMPRARVRRSRGRGSASPISRGRADRHDALPRRSRPAPFRDHATARVHRDHGAVAHDESRRASASARPPGRPDEGRQDAARTQRLRVSCGQRFLRSKGSGSSSDMPQRARAALEVGQAHPDVAAELPEDLPAGSAGRGRRAASPRPPRCAVNSRRPSEIALKTATRSAHMVRPYVAFSTLQPVTISPGPRTQGRADLEAGEGRVRATGARRARQRDQLGQVRRPRRARRFTAASPRPGRCGPARPAGPASPARPPPAPPGGRSSS